MYPSSNLGSYYSRSAPAAAAFYNLMSEAWASKHPSYDFRKLQTLSFSTTGSGQHVTLLKKGNTFFVGNWLKTYISNDDPIDRLWHPWFISKKNRLHLLNYGLDQSAQNLLSGMWLSRLHQQKHPNYIIRNNTCLVTYPAITNLYYDKGITVYNNGDIRPIGRAIDPVVMKGDKQEYKRSREALRHYWKLLTVYARHKTLIPLKPQSWYAENPTMSYWGWSPIIIQRLLAYHKKGVYELTPKNFHLAFQGHHRYPIPALRTVYTNFAQAAVKLDYSRIVDSSCKDYTEAPRYRFSSEPNYAKLIGVY